jgi:hypothetical protein
MARKQVRTEQAHATAAPAPPRYAPAWAALAYVLCALSLAYPALAGQFLVNPNSDQYKAGYAFREFAASYMKAHGGFPQWNPYLLGGMPYIAAMHGDIFYPTFLLRLVLPVDVAMTWGMILHFFLCGFATYWFLRVAARLSFHAALLGGVAYMMGGFVSSLLSAGHDGKLFVSALLPVALLVVTWCIRDGKKWAWGVLSIVVGLAVLTPHPQLLQYLLLAAGAWALFLAVGGVGDERLPRAVAVRRLAGALAAVIVGGAIGAIQYVPVLEYVQWSPRGPGFGYQEATNFSFPLEELLNTYLPQFSGILDQYWGRNQFHFHSEYVGAGVLVLATAAFGGGWMGAQKRFLWFWVGAGIVSLLWALGDSTPFFQVVYAVVPGTKFFRAPSTIFYVTTFSIAILAALGTERLLSGRLGTRFGYGWLIGAGALTLIALVGGLTLLSENLASNSPNPELAARNVELAAANAGAVRLGALRSLAFSAAVCGVILLLARRSMTPRLAGWTLVAICAADLWSVERLYWEFSPPASQLYATNGAIDFVKKVSQPVRVLALMDERSAKNPYDPFLKRDALMTHRIRLTNGYHGNDLGRYEQLRSAQSQDDQFFNPTFWALTNTDFLLVNVDTIPIPGVQRLIGPVRDAAGTNVSLFLLPGEHPFAWVAPAIMKYPDSSVLDALHTANFPVRSVALFDASSRVAGVQAMSLPAPLAITTHVDTYEPGHIALTLSAPAPRGAALVVSENFYPGWKATVDGKPVEAERADLVLIGVPLPEGAKQVELTFASEAYAEGKAITIAAVALSLIAVIAGLLGGGLTPGGMPGREANVAQARAQELAA